MRWKVDNQSPQRAMVQSEIVRKNRFIAAGCAVLLTIGIALWSHYSLPAIVVGSLCVVLLFGANHWVNTDHGSQAVLVQILAIIGAIWSCSYFQPRHDRFEFYLNQLLAFSLGSAIYGFVSTAILKRKAS